MGKMAGNKEIQSSHMTGQKQANKTMLPAIVGVSVLLLLGIVLALCKYSLIIPVLLWRSFNTTHHEEE